MEIDKMKQLEEICEIKDKLVSLLSNEISSMPAKDINTSEYGEVVDMVKDISELEKYCWESCYYQKVVEAMEDHEPRYSEFSGYNNNRYANGRYAPSGHGNMTRGYRPYLDQMPYVEGYLDDESGFVEMMDRMGYGNGNSGRSSRSSSSSSMRSGYGNDYEQYKEARRHFHETNSERDKMQMNDRAIKHFNGALTTFEDIWNNADPNLRKEMKESLSSLVNEW